jgi:hypothetical protein
MHGERLWDRRSTRLLRSGILHIISNCRTASLFSGWRHKENCSVFKPNFFCAAGGPGYLAATKMVLSPVLKSLLRQVSGVVLKDDSGSWPGLQVREGRTACMPDQQHSSPVRPE